MLPGVKNVRIQDAFFAYMENGGSRELGVNGSITPVRFEITFPVTNRDFLIVNASLVFSGGKIDEPLGFVGIAPPGLTSGMELGFITPSGDFPMLSSPFKTNFDLIAGSGVSKPWGFDSAINDAIQVEFLTDYLLKISTGQIIGMYLIVNDNLTTLTGRFACRGNNI